MILFAGFCLGLMTCALAWVLVLPSPEQAHRALCHKVDCDGKLDTPPEPSQPDPGESVRLVWGNGLPWSGTGETGDDALE